MTIASLASQFSDVRAGLKEELETSGQFRLGATLWFGVDLTNSSGIDAYLLVTPRFRTPNIEYTPFPVSVFVAPVKRLDVVGSPSPFGSSISQMLQERWRFFVPAGKRVNYSFFVPAEGLGFSGFSASVVDQDGNEISANIKGPVFWAVGSPHAIMTDRVEQDLEAVS